MTLRQFDLLVKRFSVSIERQEFRVAKICSSIYNANGVKKKGSKQGFSPQDFLPKLEVGKMAKKQINAEGLLKKVEMLNMMFGGIDNRQN